MVSGSACAFLLLYWLKGKHKDINLSFIMFLLILLIIPGLRYSCLVKLVYPRTQKFNDRFYSVTISLRLVVSISLKLKYQSVLMLCVKVKLRSVF